MFKDVHESVFMTSKEHILSTIKSKKTEIFQFGIRSIGLFGSYVRDEQSENSDIDILIDFEPEREIIGEVSKKIPAD
jgi:uncharacterized protein